MIKYKLICKNCELSFDSWFASSQEYDKLKKRNFLNCHNCNSNNVIKTLMAPRFMSKSSDKDYLKKAVQLMPSDPIVNDHFADILWMIGDKLQGRYYWKYVLNLKETEDDLKKKIMKKILDGPTVLN